jgi:hypothetical protein
MPNHKLSTSLAEIRSIVQQIAMSQANLPILIQMMATYFFSTKYCDGNLIKLNKFMEWKVWGSVVLMVLKEVSCACRKKNWFALQYSVMSAVLKTVPQTGSVSRRCTALRLLPYVGNQTASFGELSGCYRLLRKALYVIFLRFSFDSPPNLQLPLCPVSTPEPSSWCVGSAVL